MAKGGKTNEQMKALGRNLAKVANQKKSFQPKAPVQMFPMLKKSGRGG